MTSRPRGKVFASLLWVMLLALPVVAQTVRVANVKGNKPLPSGTVKGSETKYESAVNDPAYVIGPDDIINISVWREAELSRTIPVRPDGKISLPLLNDIQAAGLTPTELSTAITEKLKKYVTDPQVTAIVTEIRSRRVYILGEVNRPGAYPLLPNMTVLQALSSAGGFSQFADLKKISVLRNEGGKQMRYPFDYKEVVKGAKAKQDILLKPGDTIVVP